MLTVFEEADHPRCCASAVLATVMCRGLTTRVPDWMDLPGPSPVIGQLARREIASNAFARPHHAVLEDADRDDVQRIELRQ